MRANIVQVMAHSIEECTRPEQSWAGRFLKIFLYSCLADKLFLPFRVICNNPIISLIAVLVVYLLFLILFFPLWLLSFLLTSYGSWLTFAVLFHFLAIFIARAIAFPGSSTSTIKQMSTDTIRRLADYMEQTSVACKELASSMVLIANGKVSKEQWDVNLFTMNQIWPAIEYFQQIQVYFNDAIDQVQADKALTPDELKVLRQLCEGLSECYSHFKDLFQYMLNSREERNRGVGSQALAVLSARCLNSSEKVRSAAHSIKPSGSSGDDDMVSSVIKSLVSFASGMSGFERLSFPYLRAILKKKHRADIVQINGSNGNKIDGLLLRVSNDPRFQKEKGKMETEQAAVGMVVFCCPNAGFYECISQFNFDKSWFGYYLQHRLDVFVYNYRGYGRSEGAPTPAALKADSLKVLEFIRKEYNPAKIVVHGESIGGMIGCYLARHGNVQGLVCDRTFSSLDGAASRLMGNWAGMSLRSLVWWQTDVVDDFLFAECDKLVLQDPNDEIIADAASLRAGVASTLVYGHTSNSVPSVTPRYAIARYTQSDVPQEKEESVWFLQADDVSKPLPQEFVDHFFACCTYILEKAAKGASSDDNTRQLNNDSSPMSLIQEQISTIELVQRKGGHAEHGTSQILVADGPVEDETVGDSATSDDASSSHSQESQKIHDEKINKLNMLIRRRYIDRIVAHSLDEETATLTDSISPYHKCWIAISRITNSCGQYFGEAIGRGLDSSRTWMASFIVWNHGDTLASVEGGDPMAEVRRAIADLEFLTQAAHANEFRGSHEVNFVIKALRVLFKRNQYCFGHPPSSSSSAAASDIDPFSHQQYGSLPPSVSPTSSTSLFSKCLLNSTSIRQCSAKTVGKLIPLACGHNGWPEDDDMKEISKWLQSKNLV